LNALIAKLEALQDLLVRHATGTPADDLEYRVARSEVLADPEVRDVLPQFLKDCRDLGQFWADVKNRYATYSHRRQYIWDGFRPALEKLEAPPQRPSDALVSDALAAFSKESVHAIWQRALARRDSDIDGAITLARTLLEGVCKHVLDELHVSYVEGDELPKLYRLTAQHLQLAPDQHTEPIFKQILGGCIAVVEGIGAVRNRLSDSHGRGKAGVRASPRHAEFVVNLAGAAAMFLVATFEARKGTG